MDDTEKSVQQIEESIKNFGGNILTSNKIGRKKLAYDINGLRDGFYATYEIEFPEDKVAELRRNFKLNDNVLREMIIVQKPKTAAAK